MSSAESRAPRRRQRGFTLIEVCVALALLAVMGLVFERTLSTAQDTERYLASVSKAQEVARRASTHVHHSVGSARTLFERDAHGESYLAALDLAGREPIPGSRLVRFEEVDPLGPDLPGAPRTGNLLLFAMEVDPVACAIDPQESASRTVDVYRLVCCYLHETDRLVVQNSGRKARDFVVWTSEPYPSYAQIAGIQDKNERKNVIRRLLKEYEMAYAWDPTAPADAAFFELGMSGSLPSIPVADHVIQEDAAVSEGGLLGFGNAQAARSDATERLRRPVFTSLEGSNWRPDGFEVKVAGASGHRKVWFRLVVEVAAGGSRVAAHPTTLIIGVQDL